MHSPKNSSKMQGILRAGMNENDWLLKNTMVRKQIVGMYLSSHSTGIVGIGIAIDMDFYGLSLLKTILPLSVCYILDFCEHSHVENSVNSVVVVK